MLLLLPAVDNCYIGAVRHLIAQLHRGRPTVWPCVALVLAVAAWETAGAGAPEPLAFLGGESVTKEDIRSRLGEPSATFENDRVFTYRLDGYYQVIPRNPKSWEGVAYDLVLVFDKNSLLERHNLVSVRKP
jgi:hypothetical protein